MSRATIRGGAVLPHVQAFADAAAEATGVDSFGTYNGHSPSIDRALDIFVQPKFPAPGHAVCQFALANWGRFGITYVIFRQRINSNDGRGWRDMADRGDPTQNHMDHVHISFDESAPVVIDQEDSFMTPEQWAEHIGTLKALSNTLDRIEQTLTTDGPAGGVAGTVKAISNTLDRIEVTVNAGSHQ